MAKILYSSGHSRSAFKWGMVGEVLKRLMENPENEIYYLDCNGNIKGPCGLNHKKHWGYCRNCQIPCLKVLKQAEFPDDHILKMQKYEIPKFPKFGSIKEALNYDYDGYNLGLAPISCIMTITRDYDFSIKKWQKNIHRFLETEYTILKNIEYYDSIYHFDEIHVFNGRMASMYPYVSYAKKNNIHYVTYECGATIDSLLIVPDAVRHDYNVIRNGVLTYWNADNGDDKNSIAIKWFTNRRKGKTLMGKAFTKDQIKDSLPKDFDTTKENYVYFNSSIDELAAFIGWELPFGDNENNIIAHILEHYKDDPNKHFYLRVHPNLIRAKKKLTTQIREIYALKEKYKNLTVIDPDEKIDTYALMDAATKVLSTVSTTGCEATFWGNISISVGRAPYDDLDCVYKAHSFEDIYKLIDDKTLKPKPKESTYAYGYYNSRFGEPYRYFKVNSQNDGEFLGLKLKSK